MKNIDLHKKILTHWWQTDFKDWIRIVEYNPDPGNYYDGRENYYGKAWFCHRKSALIPPEKL